MKRTCRIAILIAVITTLSGCQEDNQEMYIDQQVGKTESVATGPMAIGSALGGVYGWTH